MSEPKCKTCRDDFYIFHHCCSGHQCGCMGYPVQVSYCCKCNADGAKEPREEMRHIVKNLEFIE